MKSVAYTLLDSDLNSNAYYYEVGKFTDEVIAKAESILSPEIESYINYLNEYKLERVRMKEEYILELLSFGVLWHTYSRIALSVKWGGCGNIIKTVLSAAFIPQDHA